MLLGWAWATLLFVVTSMPAVATSHAHGSTPARKPAAFVTKPALTVPVPQFADVVLDEPHSLVYGSDTAAGKIWVLSLPSLSTVTMIDIGQASQPLGMDLSADGSTLAVARSGFGNIVLISTTSRTVTGTLFPLGTSGPLVPSMVRFGRAGRLYSGGNPSSFGFDYIHVFDTTTLQEVGRSSVIVRDNPDLEITSDHNSLYDMEGTSFSPASLSLFDVTTDTPTLSKQAAFNSVAGSTVAIKPDGSAVYTGRGQVLSSDLQHQLGTIATQGGHVVYSPSTNRVFFSAQPLDPTQLVMADGTTFAILRIFHSAGTGAGAFRVNAAGTVAYVSTDVGLDAILLTAPGPPIGVVARAGIGSAVVSWSPPTDQGTSAITSYDVISSGGARVTVPASQTSAVLTGLSAVSHTFTVDAVNASGAGPGAISNAVTPQAGGTYHTLSPTRILDTRDGTGGFSAPIGGGGTLPLQVAGRGGVPMSGVSAVVLNVTVTDTTASSFLTVYPSGGALPMVSNLNWVAGKTVPNLVEVALGSGGQVSLFNLAGNVDVVVDVEGWVGDSSNSSGPLGMFNGLTPSRLLDTRNGGGPLGTGQTLTLQVSGRGGVPVSGVSAVVLNVTVTDTTADSFLTVYPSAGAVPVASNLNWVTGQTVPNRVIVKLGAGGQVNIFNHLGNADVVVDVNGWYTDATSTAGGSGFVATIPGRFYDERNDPNGPLPGGFFLRFTVNDPRTITGLVLNVTVTDTTASSFLTVWPDGAPLPVASDLNWVAGETVPNLTVVELSNLKQFDVYNFAGLVDVVIDVDGFYSGVVQAVSAMVVGPAIQTNAGPALARSAPSLAPKSSDKVSRHRA